MQKRANTAAMRNVGEHLNSQTGFGPENWGGGGRGGGGASVVGSGGLGMRSMSRTSKMPAQSSKMYGKSSSRVGNL